MPLLRQNKTQHSSLLQSSQNGVWERRIYVLSPHKYAIHTCSTASARVRSRPLPAAGLFRNSNHNPPIIQSIGKMCAPYSTASSSSAPGSEAWLLRVRVPPHTSSSKRPLVLRAVKPCGLDWIPDFTGTGPFESWHTLNNANADPMRMMRFLSEPRATAE